MRKLDRYEQIAAVAVIGMVVITIALLCIIRINLICSMAV